MCRSLDQDTRVPCNITPPMNYVSGVRSWNTAAVCICKDFSRWMTPTYHLIGQIKKKGKRYVQISFLHFPTINDRSHRNMKVGDGGEGGRAVVGLWCVTWPFGGGGECLLVRWMSASAAPSSFMHSRLACLATRCSLCSSASSITPVPLFRLGAMREICRHSLCISPTSVSRCPSICARPDRRVAPVSSLPARTHPPHQPPSNAVAPPGWECPQDHPAFRGISVSHIFIYMFAILYHVYQYPVATLR